MLGGFAGRRLGSDRAAVIVAASAANVVRALQFAAIRTFGVRGRLERMVGTAHVAAGLGRFLFRDSHRATFLVSIPRDAGARL